MENINIQRYKRKRKYSVNDSFFKTPNVLNSYFAGFIAADGCINTHYGKFFTSKKLSFGLSIKDKEFLETFKKSIEFSGPIVEYTQNGRKYVRLIINSTQICDDLEKNYNITPRKTYTLQPPNINDTSLIDAFICGYIDGDGCIYFSKNKNKQKTIGLNILGTENLLSWINKRFNDILNTDVSKKLRIHKSGYKKDGKGIFSLTLSFKKARVIIKKLYSLNIPHLKRKWTDEIIDYCKHFHKRLPLCRRKGVNVFNIEGIFLFHCETLQEASQKTGVSCGRISSLCKIDNNSNMAHNYMFSRTKTEMPPYDQSNLFAQKRLHYNREAKQHDEGDVDIEELA